MVFPVGKGVEVTMPCNDKPSGRSAEEDGSTSSTPSLGGLYHR